jgi:hypothetical protein
MKHAIRYILYSLFAALPLLVLSGCYTQMGMTRGEVEEGYDSRSDVRDEMPVDSVTQAEYDSTRQEFYYDNYYPYPSYSVGLGFGWYWPWYGYAYPWYVYDWYPWYGGYWPSAYWYPHYYGGYYGYYGRPYSYYNRGYGVRRFGMARTSGVSRGTYSTHASTSVTPARAGRIGAARGTVMTGRSTGRRALSSSAVSPRARAAYAQRNRTAARAPAGRYTPSRTGSIRSGGRASSAPSAAPHPSSGGRGWSGGGGGSRGGGGGGGSWGGGGRR